MTDEKEQVKPEQKQMKPEAKQVRTFSVSPSPHLSNVSYTTRGMMLDVLIALVPVMIMAIYVFRWFAVVQVGVCVISCLVAEAFFTRLRGKPSSIGDLSATVTGVILGLSLPWSAPVFVGVIASFVAIGVGKTIFGGLGFNIFNPAMVGRAFVMFSFPMALGATAYQNQNQMLSIVTQATPLTVAKQLGEGTALWPLFLGTTNGSLGETSAIACILGGLYLLLRRTASWEIPVGILATVIVWAGIGNIMHPDAEWTVLHHLIGGALLFGAFFIATDPVTSPLTSKGKFIFGVGVGFIIMLLRVFSGYPEGVMFAVLLMNSVVPLINQMNIPVPYGGPVPVKK